MIKIRQIIFRANKTVPNTGLIQNDDTISGRAGKIPLDDNPNHLCSNGFYALVSFCKNGLCTGDFLIERKCEMKFTDKIVKHC